MKEIVFSKRIPDVMGKRAQKELTGGKWHGIAYPHIFLDKKASITFPMGFGVPDHLSPA